MGKRFDKTMLYAAYVYIILPYLIFVLGWLRWYYAVVIAAGVVVGAVLALNNYTDFKSIDLKKHRGKIFAVIAIIVVWVLLSGIGGYSYQRPDHMHRNAIFRDIVQHPWPVVYHNIDWLGNGLSPSYMMSYYLGFWMPAAVVGKLLGWAAAKFFLYLWTVIGLLLVFYFICRLLNRFTLSLFWIFIFFSSLYILGDFARLPVKAVVVGDFFLWAGPMIVGASPSGLMFEVFNQSITPWLILLLILNNIPQKNLFFIYYFCFFQGPFAFLGLFPFVMYIMIKEAMNKKGSVSFAERLKPFFSFQNISGAFFVLLITYFFFSGNAAAQHFTILSASVFKYIQFVILSFGILFVILFPKFRREPLYYISLAVLLIIPFFQLGHGMDTCGRVSIPSMFVLMLFTMRVVLEEKGKMIKKVVVAYLLLAAIEPALSIGRSAVFTIGNYVAHDATSLYLYNREQGYPLWTPKYVKAIPDSAKRDNFLIKDQFVVINTKLNPDVRNFIANFDKSFFYKHLAKQEEQ